MGDRISELPPATDLHFDDQLLMSDTSELLTKRMSLSMIVDRICPIGTLYITVLDVNPSVYFGGTWEAYGEGRTIVGQDPAEPEFDTADNTGGADTHTLTTAELPVHGHAQKVTANVGSSVRRDWNSDGGASSYSQGIQGYSTGGGGAHNNIMPYITTYTFRRTA